MSNKLFLTALLCALAMPPASAHVTLAQVSAAAGSRYKAVFRVPHGCDGSATKAITVFFPAGTSSVQAVPKAGWTLDVKTEKSGNADGLRITQVSWGNNLLPAKQGDEFVAVMTLPPTAGKLYFRVLQSCEKGEADWAEISADGAPAPKSPAPVLEVVRTYTVGKITISHPWARATVPAQTTGGAFLTLENTGAADTLVAVGTDVARSAQLHSMTMDGTVMKMKKMDGLDLPAGKTVELNPGNFHIMLTELKAPLKQGDTFPLKLKFARAGEITVDVQVESINASGTPAADDHMHMHH